MKKLFFIIFAGILIPASVFAYTSPGKPSGFVNDFADVIGVSERQAIEGKLRSIQQTTGMQVSVVTVSSLGEETVETYAVKLFEEWGIGQKGKDNGLLILVAPTEREVKIETGYGTESIITDLQSGNIIRDVMLPAFRQGKYGEGISGAVDAVSSIITDSPDAAQYSAPDDTGGSYWPDINPVAVLFLVIIIFNILARVLGKTKSWWLGGVLGAAIGTVIGLIWGFIYAGVNSIVILSILGFIFDYVVSKNPPKSGGNGGRGGIWPIFLGGGRGGSGGSSFGGGGGFGGFGGGMSGGGGASGRW